MNLSNRFAYEAKVSQFLLTQDDEILGQLTNQHKFRQLEQQQINAWRRQIVELKQVLADFPRATLLLEFEIPRIGKRVDAILILNGSIVVLEYKVGTKSYDTTAIDQAHDYALDLKNFHKASHHLNIVPILVATDAPDKLQKLEIEVDGVAIPVLANSDNLLNTLNLVSATLPKVELDPNAWIGSTYHPTPTIVEAAQALYKGHKVDEISRSDAGAINLTKTCGHVSRVIDDAKANNKKVICLITGSPRAGKSLAGLNIAIERMRYLENEHAVFLSGNGPLVAVLREAGITEWITALKEHYQDWEIHFSDEIFKSDYALSREWLENQGALKLHIEADLNLAISLRSFRAEKLSEFVGALISGNANKAKEIKEHLTNYPIYLTRSLSKAKNRLRDWARGSERIGLVASSNAIRLKPSGIFVKGEIDPTLWFLKGKGDIRSSHYLEDVATEFDVQGLEIDWVGVCWDANFRRENGKWVTYNFSGSKWQTVHDLEKQKYIANSYRVLLTRGRQGIVIFVPEGDDSDPTRQKIYYDQTFDFLKSCGIGEI